MPRIRALLLSATALAFAPAPAHALEGVVASIKPVHSLVAGVMKGAGEPYLLVRGAASPHTYSLRPSDARALESAGLVFWVGPQMEVALDSAIDTLSSGARVVELGDAHGLTKLPFREGGPFEAHDHEDDEGPVLHRLQLGGDFCPQVFQPNAQCFRVPGVERGVVRIDF